MDIVAKYLSPSPIPNSNITHWNRKRFTVTAAVNCKHCLLFLTATDVINCLKLPQIMHFCLLEFIQTGFETQRSEGKKTTDTYISVLPYLLHQKQRGHSKKEAHRIEMYMYRRHGS